MRAGSGIDELRCDAQPVRRSANAAFEHIANAEIATHLSHIHRSALVGKG
jgi:hypothetical protein